MTTLEPWLLDTLGDPWPDNPELNPRYLELFSKNLFSQVSTLQMKTTTMSSFERIRKKNVPTCIFKWKSFWPLFCYICNWTKFVKLFSKILCYGKFFSRCPQDEKNHLRLKFFWQTRNLFVKGWIGFVGIEISSIVILSVNVSNKTHHQLHGFYLMEVGLYKWPPRYFLVDNFSIWAHLPLVTNDILRLKYFTI